MKSAYQIQVMCKLLTTNKIVKYAELSTEVK